MKRVKNIALFIVLSICFTGAAVAQSADPPAKLPTGMTGSSTSDPRAKLSPGWYDAGEAISGMKHVSLLKKPDAFSSAPTIRIAPKLTKHSD